MKKTLRFTSAIALIAAMCLSACNKAELIVDNPFEQPGTEEPQSSGWKVAISATMGGTGTKALAEDPDTHNLIATFETTDNIYVYNVTKSKVDSSPLHPDRNGASAILTGTLSESYDEGDILVLCYNPEYIDDYGGDIRFDYTNQNGTLAAVADFAKADKTVSAAEAAAKELSGTVSFTNLQSIFKFTFTDGSSAVPVHKVTISTAQGQLVQTDLSYHHFGGMYKGEIRVTPAGTTTEPVYVALRNDTSADDTFYFEIEDGSGLIYKGEKAAPAGKIVNGKFYASTVILAQVPKPTVILTDSGSAVEPNDGNYGYLDAGSLTVSGTGEGYYFSWASQSFKSLTLSGASIICYSREPVSSSRSILNPIILEGDNYIITDADHAAVAYKSNFSGTDFSQFIKGNGTLTITASSTVGTKGFKNTYSSPVNVVASPGFTLTVSDGVDNGDGTTTWVYTVAPEPTIEMVDLGLPSGTLWAKYNLGVEDPTVDPYGNYYAWGETTPRTGYHTYASYKLGDGTNKFTCLTKYIIDDGYTYAAGIDGKTKLEPSDDAATAALGTAYCTPAAEDWIELWSGQYVTFQWSYINCVNPDFPDLYPNLSLKVYGILVRSRSNGNSIFLPAAGLWGERMSASELSRGQNGSSCNYWSSTLYAFPNSYPHSFEAYCLDENSSLFYYDATVNGNNPDLALSLNSMPSGSRCLGMPVRPVKHQ